ncbi:Enoyl-CoA delta isomerase 2, mitochondrial [Phlyctochytrium bullatum]|nr:Enoyl-CoA delta isomerase 2, mitochondrial [Phlyctochytrium bullatum]
MVIRSFKTIEVVDLGGGVREIAFNRPEKYNAFSPQVYDDLLAALQDAATDPTARVTILTGRGKFYSSGQELTSPPTDVDPVEFINFRGSVTRKVADTMINFPTLLIAAVNGPVIGFACTSLTLCDLVYSVPHATFNTPFMELALAVEGCSSLIFPRVMGHAKANEILLLGEKHTAQEWEQMGMITRILPADNFLEQVRAIAKKAATFSPTALAKSKRLIVNQLRDRLIETNRVEMDLVVERMLDPEFAEKVFEFMCE